MIEGSSIKELLELADLVDDKKSFEEWEFYWQNLMKTEEETTEQA